MRARGFLPDNVPRQRAARRTGWKEPFRISLGPPRPHRKEPCRRNVAPHRRSTVSTGVECVERLFGLAPKSRFVAVQTFKCAAIEVGQTQETVRQMADRGFVLAAEVIAV